MKPVGLADSSPTHLRGSKRDDHSEAGARRMDPYRFVTYSDAPALILALRARRPHACLQPQEKEALLTTDVATGIARILKQEGVEWVSTFPVCRVNNALGRENVPMLMMRDDRYAIAVADAFSRITGGRQIGVATVQGGVNAAGLQVAYAGLAQAYEDNSPMLCITDGVPIGSTENSHFDLTASLKPVKSVVILRQLEDGRRVASGDSRRD